MSQPIESESDRKPTDIERVRWVMLGFGSADDLSDMPQERIAAAKEKLSVAASAFAKSGLKQPVVANYRFVKAAAVAACSVFLVYGLFVSIQNAVASQQVLAGNEYAQSLIEISLDLFEEDLGVISDQAARSDVLLPEPAFWSVDRFTQKRMHACPQAIQALTSVRMGFPEAGCYQLENIPMLFHENGPWESDSQSGYDQRDLEFVFHLTAGKALFESLQTTVARSYLTNHSRDFSKLAETSYQSLQHALEMIQEDQFVTLSVDEGEVLKSAIEIDLARARLKFGGLALTGESQSGMEQKEQIRLELELVKQQLKNLEPRDVRCLIQSARCLNNQILATEQKLLLSPPTSATEMRQLVGAVSEEITELFEEIEQVDGALEVPAMNFEIALCYSNLADLIRGLWDSSKLPEQSTFSVERIDLRQRASKLLQNVSRVNRTERHFENLVTNEARQLQTEFIDGMLADINFTPSDDLRFRAIELNKLVSNVLEEGDVGQLPVESRVVVALLLPDLYSIEAVQQFATRLPDIANRRSRPMLKKLVKSKSDSSEPQ